MISTIFYLMLLTLQFINTILHILRPLGSRLAVVKSLPGNRLANRNTEMPTFLYISSTRKSMARLNGRCLSLKRAMR